jgi:hypothetical protein
MAIAAKRRDRSESFAKNHSRSEFVKVHRGKQPDTENPRTDSVPFIIQEGLPALTETAFR